MSAVSKPLKGACACGSESGTRTGERGSALLIVFVFAATVAIMLYMEMPVAAFEAQRQKEQLLIDRGDEYAHAVKLFVRKTGTYPGSLDALENTNNMRFLRHRFVDPFTQKDNWRVLHAGPGGVITDSKVNPMNSNLNGTNGSNRTNSNSGFGSSASLASSNSAASSSDSSAEFVVARPVVQRPSAIPANGGSTPTASSAEAGQDPSAPLLPAGQAEQLTNNSPAAVDAQAGTQAASGQTGSASQSASAQGVNDMMRNLANNPNPTTPQGTASTMGRMMGGGIAGVASIAKGHSIKVVNDQIDYSLWEFYYDPSKDLAAGLGGGMQTGAGAAGTSNSSNNNGGFGQSSTTQTGFGFNSSSPSPSDSGTGNAVNVPAAASPRVSLQNSPQ